MKLPPDRQPRGGWLLTLQETGGVVTGENWADFVTKVNEQLRANAKDILSQEAIMERIERAAN